MYHGVSNARILQIVYTRVQAVSKRFPLADLPQPWTWGYYVVHALAYTAVLFLASIFGERPKSSKEVVLATQRALEQQAIEAWQLQKQADIAASFGATVMPIGEVYPRRHFRPGMEAALPLVYVSYAEASARGTTSRQIPRARQLPAWDQQASASSRRTWQCGACTRGRWWSCAGDGALWIVRFVRTRAC